MSYKAVLFDLDGTVMDTSEGILISLKETIEKFGLEVLPDEELRKFIGPPIEWSFESHYGVTGQEQKDIVACFRDRYSNHNLLHASVYDGVFEFMDALRRRGVKIGIATYKKEDYALKLLRAFEVDKKCDAIHGSHYDIKETKADIIVKCLGELGITDRKDVLMVGDSKHDAMGANNLGIDFAGVSFGFGFESGQKGENIDEYEHVAYTDHMLDLISLFEDKEDLEK